MSTERKDINPHLYEHPLGEKIASACGCGAHRSIQSLCVVHQRGQMGVPTS
uniref:Uncharacterized protein n=1 Tax=Arundo donax TaxID=35708 RepID=A0A0A9LTE2_ARUDO